jgi:hypothetical protein
MTRTLENHKSHARGWNYEATTLVVPVTQDCNKILRRRSSLIEVLRKCLEAFGARSLACHVRLNVN